MKKKLFGLLTLVGLLAGCQNIPSSSAEPSTPPSSVAPSSTLPSSETPTTSQTPPSSNSSSENPSTPPISSSTPEPEPEPTVNDILVQLQSDELAVQGTLTQYVNQEGYEPQSASSTISCYISDSRYYNVEMEDGEVTYLTDYVADEDGLVSTRSLDPETNTVIDTPVYSGGETVLFSEMFYNPFVSIAAEDVTVEDGVVTFDISDQLAFEIAYVTTFYSDIPMDTLTATVDEDYNVTSVTIGYENHVENDPQYGTYTEGAKYVFELVTAEEIGVPKTIEPRPENPKTEPLAELFEDLAAGNYTVHTETLWGESIDELYEDQNADLKVTEEGVLHQDNYYGTTSGYLKVEEGIAEVVLEDGKLVGQGVPSASSLAEVVGLSPFSYMANMFDVSEDGKTFTLASGYGLVDNAYLLIPDPITYPNAYPDEGKFTITFNDDGTYTFAFTETLAMWGYVSIYDVEMTVSDIGTTELGYDASDYVAYHAPESWEEVSGAVELFQSAAIDPSLVPWVCPDGCEWYFSDLYETLALDIADDLVATEVGEEFEAGLVEIGWEYQYTADSENYYQYVTEEGDILQLSIYSSDFFNEVYLFVYEPILAPSESALRTWIVENFTSSTNYTMTGTVKYFSAPCDQDTYEPTGEYTSFDAFEINYQYTDEAVYYQYEDPLGYGLTDYLAINRADETVDVYDIIDGEAIAYGSYDGDYQTAVTYTMRDLAAYSSFVADSEDPSVYAPENSQTEATLGELLGVNMGNDDVCEDFVLTFDEENDTLTIDYVLNDGIYYTDSTQTTVELGYYAISLTISDVGTTVIDPAILALVAE